MTNKTSHNGSRKESGATAPAKSHESKNSNIVENTARKLRSKQVRLTRLEHPVVTVGHHQRQEPLRRKQHYTLQSPQPVGKIVKFPRNPGLPPHLKG